jgi:alkylation response protein AidB-like acyl-CoA dehydrogenase
VASVVNAPAAPAAASRAAFRAVVDAEIAPHADSWDAAERIPPEVLDRVAGHGWWGASLPREVGGADMSWAAIGALHEEVGRGCSSLRSLLTVHTMVTWALDRWGTAEQRERWLPELASGHLRGAFCLTEPDAGSDAAAIATTAEPYGAGFSLTGTKLWITGGQVAHLYLVFARCGGGISAFLVPREAPGLTATPIGPALGTRASMLAEVRLRDCRVDGDSLLGPQGFGLQTVVTGALDIGRLSVACGSVGIVAGCLEASAAYAARRVHRDGPLKDRQLVRRMLTDMVVGARAGRLLCDEAARLKDDDDPGTIMATWVAKYHASRAAARAASDAVQIHGARGCTPGHRVDRFYRDAKVMEIIEGSSELQQLTIADDAYREPTS